MDIFIMENFHKIGSVTNADISVKWYENFTQIFDATWRIYVSVNLVISRLCIGLLSRWCRQLIAQTKCCFTVNWTVQKKSRKFQRGVVDSDKGNFAI